MHIDQEVSLRQKMGMIKQATDFLKRGGSRTVEFNLSNNSLVKGDDISIGLTDVVFLTDTKYSECHTMRVEDIVSISYRGVKMVTEANREKYADEIARNAFELYKHGKARHTRWFDRVGHETEAVIYDNYGIKPVSTDIKMTMLFAQHVDSEIEKKLSKIAQDFYHWDGDHWQSNLLEYVGL